MKSTVRLNVFECVCAKGVPVSRRYSDGCDTAEGS